MNRVEELIEKVPRVQDAYQKVHNRAFNTSGEKALLSIPARRDDPDLMVCDYIADTAAALRDLRDRLAEAEKAITEIDRCCIANDLVGMLKALDAALTAYPPKPASERTT